ncbi:hypothetical protein MTO96_043177 [Rhipicephalus appendiculatus]
MQGAVPLFCLCVIAGSVRSQAFLGDDPSLQEYQDEEDCVPFIETWYEVYRNFEKDPFYGGNATCIRVRETGPYTNGSATGIVEYTPNVTL